MNSHKMVGMQTFFVTTYTKQIKTKVHLVDYVVVANNE